MNLREWQTLPAGEFAAKLRDANMTPERYRQLVTSIEADERLEAELRAAGQLPDKLPEGKLGDSDSYGITPAVD
jgi:hypothetical protein